MKSKKKFLIMNLPTLPFIRVLGFLNFVTLSMCSEKTRLKMEKCKMKPKHIKIKHTSMEHGIELELGSPLKIIWNFEKKIFYSDLSDFCDNYNICSFSFMTKKIEINGPNETFNTVCNNYHITMCQLIQYLSNTFDFPQCSISCLLNAEGCKYFGFLLKPRESREEGDDGFFGVSKELLPQANQEFEFGFILIGEDMIMQIIRNQASDFRNPKPLTHNSVWIRHPWKIHYKVISHLIWEELLVAVSNDFEVERLNTFLKQWLEGEYFHLIFANIRPSDMLEMSIEQLNETLFDGIQVLEYDKNRKVDDYIETPFTDALEKMDFACWDIRRNDGTMASIGVFRNFAMFCAWRPIEEEQT